MTTVPSTAIETVSGKLVDLANPIAEDILSEDIAWALSREPRFGGHTITETIYSVGQHSIHVADILASIWIDGPIRDAFLAHGALPRPQRTEELLAKHQSAPKWLMLFGLLHDASEAYMRDLPSPVKALPGLREAYLAVEKVLMDVILMKYELYSKDENGEMKFSNGCTKSDYAAAVDLVHWADLYARTVEAYHFMPSRGAHWHSSQKVTLIDLQQFQLPKKSIEVYRDFLMYLEELTR